jgi:crotonobetainyl-CoA:carnitine CoA-transferase CaiB-like acyl-CoA transferase
MDTINSVAPDYSSEAVTAPLKGVRIIECGEGVSAAFTTKLLALLGAEVIKVESPHGDITRLRGPFFDDQIDSEKSGLFLYLNAGKSGVTLDLAEPSDRARLDQLLASAEALVHNLLPRDRGRTAMESDNLSQAHPHLIVAAISPYGAFGPRARYNAYELNVIHSGGAAAVAPLCSDSPDLPPLKLFGHQAEFQAANHAAFVILAALFERMTHGRGQAIEVSAQECFASMLELSLVAYTYSGVRTSRLGRRLLGPWSMLDCADGKILLCCIEEHQWHRLITLMGHPEWAQEELFKDRFARGRNVDALSALLGDWAKDWRVADLVHAAQERRIPAAPVNRLAQVYNDRHLHERGFFAALPQSDNTPAIEVPIRPFVSSATKWTMNRPAPHLGEHNEHWESFTTRTPSSAQQPRGKLAKERSAPLAGVRVLDFTWVWQGPYCTLQLAHLGAEVIRIESIRRLDVNRVIPPFADRKEGRNRAGSFNQWNQGKRSLRLNLEIPEAVEIAKSLAQQCDLVVENFAPGVISRLGLGYEVLRQLRPDIIMLSLSGYGQTGPYSQFVSYGGLLGGQSGLFSVSGYTADKPAETGITYGDPNAGAIGAYAAITALLHRARTGQGQHIDVSLWEALEMLLPEAWLEYAMNRREPQVTANRDRWMAPHNCYKSRGDAEEWVTIAVGNEDEWRSFCRALGQPSLASDARFLTPALRKQHEDELDAIVTQWTSQNDRWEITEHLQRVGVAAMPTLSNKDIAHDPHLRERGFLVELVHPEVGCRTHAGIPWTMSATPCKVRNPAPLFGADTKEVLATLLGYSAERIEHLSEAGVLS